MRFRLYNEDCLQVLRRLKSDNFAALVTDPPAGISFMGKEWDDDKGGREQWIAWLTEVMRECYRVMKPGAHGLVWALPRTSHWTATALENAGFEIRDRVQHIFGTGFPKSLDVSKAIDKAAGAEREVVGRTMGASNTKGFQDDEHDQSGGAYNQTGKYIPITAPATAAAKQWAGWGTALKPACEDWWLIRKPLSEKTVAANVLKWGTGALNIDASRIGKDVIQSIGRPNGGDKLQNYKGDGAQAEKNTVVGTHVGRFPSHLVLSHNDDCGDACTDGCAVRALDEQSGVTTSATAKRGIRGRHDANSPDTERRDYSDGIRGHNDTGGASRFFYCAKASTSEKSRGLEDNVETTVDDGRQTPIDNPYLRGKTGRKNTHPTVKSVKLMEYLVRMITPPGGIVLDPFMGSGTTGIAALNEGKLFVGVEQVPAYFEIAKARIEASEEQKQ